MLFEAFPKGWFYSKKKKRFPISLMLFNNSSSFFIWSERWKDYLNLAAYEYCHCDTLHPKHCIHSALGTGDGFKQKQFRHQAYHKKKSSDILPDRQENDRMGNILHQMQNKINPHFKISLLYFICSKHIVFVQVPVHKETCECASKCQTFYFYMNMQKTVSK